MTEIFKNLNFMPIFGMIFVGWLFYLKFREKQIKNQEKITLIEKGIDPSLIYSKAKDNQNKNHQNSLKIGLLLIGIALGVMVGYILNLTLHIPNFVAYSSMILVFCGILLIYFHLSKTE
jgi:F0F1-type ATP synthase assembly protein I